MERGWNGLPFRPISQHYQKLFGEKVYKIPVAVVEDCPNRMGLKGMETCVFCDQYGSAARVSAFDLSLDEQITQFRKIFLNKYKAKKYLVYFQAYTNTFTKFSALRTNFEKALKHEGVTGFVLGTRPDCLSPAVLNLWNEYSLKAYVGVELGVQSFFEDDLIFMKRGHTAQQSLDAIQKISSATTVDLGIHLIFGNPGETDERILQTAEIVNELPITNIKLHHLHVLKGTPLEEMFLQGKFTPISFPDYSRRVRLFLENLSPRFSLHRLAAYSPRWEELVAPAWTADKMKTHQGLIDDLRSHASYQSKFYAPQSDVEKDLQKQIYFSSLPQAQDDSVHSF